MKRVPLVLIALAIAALAVVPALSAQNMHVIQAVAETQWGPAPPMLPPGAQIAVLSGDPGKPGPYTARLKFPAGYRIPAHSHPTDEHVVVTSGTFFLGMGNKLDPSAGKALPIGGFGLLPAGMNHFAYAGNQETTVVLYGQGPVEFKYVNPQDDPRNKK